MRVRHMRMASILEGNTFFSSELTLLLLVDECRHSTKLCLSVNKAYPG